jgi:hypothetical protein
MPLCLGLVLTGSAVGQDAPLLTSGDITTKVGGDADVRAIVSLVFAHAFQDRSKTEFFLNSQIRREWLPAVPGVKFVALSDAETADHLAKCGLYWIVRQLDRSGDVVSLRLAQKCGGTLLAYVTSFDGQQWRLGPPNLPSGSGWVPGIGSGFAVPPIGCPCLPR